MILFVGDLPWPHYHRDRILRGVDGDHDVQLLLGKPVLSGLPVVLGKVRVVGVNLVDPHSVPERDAVKVERSLA